MSNSFVETTATFAEFQKMQSTFLVEKAGPRPTRAGHFELTARSRSATGMAESGPELSWFGLLCAGASAGVAVDTSLYPVDTLRTRSQASEGFFKAGGFRGIYRGFGAAALG